MTSALKVGPVENPSELEKFLTRSASEGKVESEGQFTLARDQALKKIAEFQLPFRAAWAVKLVQCAVASGDGSPIRVDLTVKEARFFFVITDLNLTEIEEAFYTPEPSEKRSLRHLLSSLWAVGLHEGCGFQLALPGSSTTLIWDGKSLNRVESEEKRTCAYLAIAHQPVDGGKLAWVKGLTQSGSRNLEIQTTLSRCCYTCPVPLTVDARRVDSLQFCPTHGLSDESYPLSLRFEKADLPALSLPPGTFEKLPSQSTTTFSLAWSGEGLREVGEKTLRSIKPQQEASVAFLLTAHLKLKNSGKSVSWEDTEDHSVLYWVQDGVVVDQENLFDGKTHCSVACFLNATELPTDLTGLHLTESPERSRRAQAARQCLAESLGELGQLAQSLKDLEAKVKTMSWALGRGVFLVGVGAYWIAPQLGFSIIVFGTLGVQAIETKESQRGQRVRTGVKELQQALKDNR